MRHDEFIGEVQHRAKLPSRGDAERATRITLETFRPLGSVQRQDWEEHRRQQDQEKSVTVAELQGGRCRI